MSLHHRTVLLHVYTNLLCVCKQVCKRKYIYGYILMVEKLYSGISAMPKLEQ